MDKTVDQENAEAPAIPESILREIEDEWQRYLPLHKAILVGDWEKAEMIFNEDETVINSNFTTQTALHAAIGSGKAIDFAKNLVDRMPEHLLGIQTNDGFTPLHVAALAGNTVVAKLLVERRANLVDSTSRTGLLPLHFAAQSGHKETLEYLLSTTHTQSVAFSGQSGLKLLISTIDAGFYDVALDLAKKFPDLATLRGDQDGCSALQKIAGKVPVLSRPRDLNVFEKFIYSIPGALTILDPTKDMIRKQSLELIECLCERIRFGDAKECRRIYSDAMIKALLSGSSEAIQVILAASPDTVITTKSTPMESIYCVGIEERCEMVFHLIFQTKGLTRGRYLESLDSRGNNILHRAGKLAPQHKLNLYSCVALQMQREVQWFKEVEKLLAPQSREVMNEDGRTPHDVFGEEHRRLKVEGEMWMKTTASSCSIVAALIATVVFAAAITVPGGNNDKSGNPIFSGDGVFIIFAISDAISLFTSIISLLMFLSIITSRFAEEDFLYALPKRLIICLVCLLFSILSMTVAFGATLYIMFGQTKSWIIVPVIMLGCLLIIYFGLQQSPLVLDFVSNTYGSGNLGNQIEKMKIPLGESENHSKTN